MPFDSDLPTLHNHERGSIAGFTRKIPQRFIADILSSDNNITPIVNSANFTNSKMTIQERITDMIVNIEKDKTVYQKELADIREKHQNYDRHYTIRQREALLEKLIYGTDCKIEVLTSLKIY